MSAFVVGNKHINAMLKAASMSRGPGDGAYYYWDDAPHFFNGNIKEIGQKLVDENTRSVNSWYSKEVQSHEFKTMVLHKQYTPVEIIKACDCYSYQSCETMDWEETEAYAIVNALRKRAIDSLPGYDEAAWEIV